MLRGTFLWFFYFLCLLCRESGIPRNISHHRTASLVEHRLAAGYRVASFSNIRGGRKLFCLSGEAQAKQRFRCVFPDEPDLLVAHLQNVSYFRHFFTEVLFSKCFLDCVFQQPSTWPVALQTAHGAAFCAPASRGTFWPHPPTHHRFHTESHPA